MAIDLPKIDELIPGLGCLNYHIFNNKNLSGKLQRRTEQIGYFIRGAIYSYEKLESIRSDVIESISHRLSNGAVCLDIDIVDTMNYEIDQYFYCMRRVADSVIHYLSLTYGDNSFPSSFNDLIKNIRKDKHKAIAGPVRGLLIDYWDRFGLPIKNYRDLATHHTLILSNCIAYKTENGFGMSMHLPDDPSNCKLDSISYEKEVSAMRFLANSLLNTLIFLNHLVEQLLDVLVSSNDKYDNSSMFITPRAMMTLKTRVTGEFVPFSPMTSEMLVVLKSVLASKK